MNQKDKDRGHWACYKMYSLQDVECERPDCDKPAKVRHHVDENPLNNKRSNIEFLCYKCHDVEHGRRIAQRKSENTS